MNTIIDKISEDLGVYRFNSETEIDFKCRVIYSAMSSWIKAIAMDKPVGSIENQIVGVSKRHIYERGNAVLGSLIKMNPEVTFWFVPDENGDNPVVVLRKRLLNHGDLLNTGFDTNLTLSIAQKKQIFSYYEIAYGEVLGTEIIYSGIAALYRNNVGIQVNRKECCEEWMNNFLKSVNWSSMPINVAEMTFFNPTHKSRNNYSAWESSLPDKFNKIVLGRVEINKNGYEYYLLKPKSNLMYKIDPFLQVQGTHIRIIFALRALAGNNAIVKLRKYNDHVQIKLFAHIPVYEQMLLESYAWPKNHIMDKLCWVMYDYIWEYIMPYFEAMGIKIMEENHG